MSGYCDKASTAALFGETDFASSIPNVASPFEGQRPGTRKERTLLRTELPDPARRFLRAQVPDPARPARSAQPERRIPKASRGPVYLEGRLVLSLSFKLDSPTGNKVSVPEGERLMGRFRIWDDTARDWLDGGPTALRFETADVVMRTHPRTAIAWVGALDLTTPIVDVPDLDERGRAINRRHHLRWKAFRKG